MSQNNNNKDNSPVVIPYIGNADNDKYVAPEKSKVIPIRSYKSQEEEEDNDDDDDDDDDEQPLTSLAPTTSKSSKLASSSDSPAPEYAMVELNGELIAPVEFPPTDTCQSIFGTDRRVELGKFYMDGPEKVPTLIVGSHQLKGKVIKLKDPFCLMEKRYKVSDESESKSSSSSQPKKKKQKQIESYQIIGIVKEKYHFVTYPKVIMRQFKKH